MIGLVALFASAQAADVLFPEATPASVDDFSVAGLFYGMVISEAEKQGLDFEDADDIRLWAGADADACADAPACPANLWDRTGARLAVVVSVGRSPLGLDVVVRLHGVDEAAPFKVLEESVPPGQELAIATKIARTAKDVLPLLPARRDAGGGPVLVLEDEVMAMPGDVTRRPPPEPKPDPDPDPVDQAPPPIEPAPRDPDRQAGVPPGNDALRDRLRADEDRRRMGLPAGAYTRYEASGLSKRAWLDAARVRAGRGFLEIGGGWSIGDVDRGYGVRLRIEGSGSSFDAIGSVAQEGPSASAAPNFGLTLGYAPAWWMDTSVSVAVQYGTKYLDTGWECLDRCDPPAREYTHDPVGAVQAFVEPRLRFYPVATGVVKPYALVAFSVLLHDGFEVPDSDYVDYPDSLAGAAFGPTAGIGLAFDPVSRVSIYGEVPGTLLFGGASTVREGEVTLTPTARESAGYVIRFVGGIAVRL